MSITLKKDQWKVKDPSTGTYRGSAIFSTTLPEDAAQIVEDATDALDTQQVRAQGIVNDAQNAVNSIDGQRETMIASIASVAGQGTDTTLTTPGVAADAAACGDLKNTVMQNIFVSGTNLFNKNSSENDSTIMLKSDGTTMDSGGNYGVTGFIPIVPRKIYTYKSRQGGTYNCWYTFDKVFIDSVSNNNQNHPYQMQAPNNAYYVRLSYGTAEINATQLNESPTVLPYENYEEYSVSSEIRKIEKFDPTEYIKTIDAHQYTDTAMDEISYFSVSKNLLNKNASGVLESKLVDPASTSIYDNDSYNTTDFIPVENGDHVTLSAHQGISSQSAVYFRTIAIYNSSKGIITKQIVDGTNAYVKDFVVNDSNAAYVRGSINKTVWASSDIMIEITDDGEETSYQPYFDSHQEIKKSALPVEETLSASSNKIPTSEAVSDALRRFVGAKITALGDSITYGATWFAPIEAALGTIIVNKGYSGNRLIDIAGSDVVESIPEDTELLLIMLGMNDWSNNTPIGDKKVTTENTTDLTGGVNTLVSKIINHIPNAKIICLGVTFGYYPNRSTFTDARGIYNNLGLSSIEVGREIVDMFKRNGIESYNVGEYCGWNENNITSYCISDGAYIHPNSTGGNILGNMILNLIK